MTLENIAIGLVQQYPKIKYSPYATLHGYVMYWDETRSQLSESPKIFPKNTYRKTWQEFIEELKTRKDWAKPRFKLPDLPSFERQNLLAEALANRTLVREEFIKRLEQPLQAPVSDILFERDLIAESAETFIDSFDPERIKRDPDRDPLEYFLNHYDITRKGHRQKPEKSYEAMLIRLKTEGNWEEIYMQRLTEKEETLARRVQSIFNDIEANNFEEQERMQMLEFLTEKGCVGLVDTLGQDAYDVLIAIYGEEQFPEEKRHLISSAKVIRPHLGKCRKTRVTREFNIWERDLLKGLKERGLKPAVYERSITVQRILQTKFLHPYLIQWESGQEIKDELKERTKDEDPITRKLANYALAHVERMEAIRTYAEISITLAQIRIR